MKKTVLNYVIHGSNENHTLPLMIGALDYIDDYTSKYKNDFDLIDNSPKKDMIYSFIKEHNNKRGKVIITHSPNLYLREQLSVLYKDDSNVSVFESENSISEIEKAKKLLFNSKDQLFSFLLLNSSTLSRTLAYELLITESEYLLAQKKGLSPIIDGDDYYISFVDLINYRINNNKLGAIRDLYENMLDFWQSNLEEMYYEDRYYYSRELKVLICKYNEIKSKKKMINNLRIGKINKKVRLNKINKQILIFNLIVNKSS